MSIFDVLSSFTRSVAKTTVNQRADAARKFERENPNMSAAQRQKLNEFNRMTDKISDTSNASPRSSYSSVSRTSTSSAGREVRFMGKTINEWDSCWQSIGMLKNANLSPYSHCVGLYRHIVNGEIKYIGRAIELHNGGFRKRLSDYRRESPSARKHKSGQLIFEHLDEIETEIMIVGNTDEAIDATRKLEGIFVNKYHPEWNKQINI